MADNLLVSYDLHAPGKNYERLVEAIKQQSDGRWARLNLSYWFIKSHKNTSDIAAAIRSVMDANDKLIVINVDKDQAVWYNLGDDVSKYLQNNWHS